MKTKSWLFATPNVRKATLELDQCATWIVHQAIPTSLPSATNPRAMAEEWAPSSNAQIVKSGDSCGTQNARKVTMPSPAACARPSVHKAWLI